MTSHDQTQKWEEAIRRLLSLNQRNRLVSDHVIDFRTLAVQAGWPEPALKGIFHQSLNDKIKDHLCSQPEANPFEDLVTAALRYDVRLRERQAERDHLNRKQQSISANHSPLPKLSSQSGLEVSNNISEEPMQVGH